jgi:4'-phosphopantetheinyl transferase
MADPVHVTLAVWPISGPPTAADRAALTAEERARAARFHDPAHGAAFTRARAGFRRRLAGALAVAPQEVVLRYGPWGKPALDPTVHGTAAALAFNLTHGAGWAALATTRDVAEIGVDLEGYRPVVPGLAARVFSPAECARLAPLGDGAAATGTVFETAFFEMWTAKESVLKAVGTGLSRDPRTVTVLPPDSDGAARVVGLMPTPCADAPWRVVRLHPPVAGMALAIALPSGERHVLVERPPVPLVSP